jgi:hypothetical protein
MDYIQVCGPFSKDQDIIQYMKDSLNKAFTSLVRIGVQSEVGNIININGQDFEIGKTGILEFNEVNIISLKFLQDESANTIIDAII